jgi:hypothetical protein
MGREQTVATTYNIHTVLRYHDVSILSLYTMATLLWFLLLFLFLFLSSTSSITLLLLPFSTEGSVDAAQHSSLYSSLSCRSIAIPHNHRRANPRHEQNNNLEGERITFFALFPSACLLGSYPVQLVHVQTQLHQFVATSRSPAWDRWWFVNGVQRGSRGVYVGPVR